MFAANKKLGLRDEEGGTVLGDGDPGRKMMMMTNHEKELFWEYLSGLGWNITFALEKALYPQLRSLKGNPQNTT